MLILVNDNEILISDDGEKYIIENTNPLYEELKDKSNEEIKSWYLNDRFIN